MGSCSLREKLRRKLGREPTREERDIARAKRDARRKRKRELAEKDESASAPAAQLITANNKSGFKGVYPTSASANCSWCVKVVENGKLKRLPGTYARATDAAAAYAEHIGPEAVAAANEAMSSEDALALAAKEGLHLTVSGDTLSGYECVSYQPGGRAATKPYKAYVWQSGKTVVLGRFASAEAKEAVDEVSEGNFRSAKRP